MLKKSAWYFAFFLVMAGSAAADVPSYGVEKEKSFIKFIAIQNAAPVEGRFDNYDADIRFDPEQLDDSSIKVTVQAGSASSRNMDVQNNIKLPEWLASETFPAAVFASRKITRIPMTNNYYAEGELSLKNRIRPVTINFTVEKFNGDVALVSGFVTLKRGDFNIGEGEWSRDDVVKNEVRVEFRLLAKRQ